MGAPWYILARECAYPEYCVPAIGWQPTKWKSYASAIAKHRSQITRLTPTVSMTMAPSAIKGAFAVSQSMENCG